MNISSQYASQVTNKASVVHSERQEVAVDRKKSVFAGRDAVTLSDSFMTGKNHKHSLGVMALGGEGQIEAWRDKGLNVSDEAVEAAFDAFNKGVSEALESQSNPRLVLNRHAIVASAQAVPDWFSREAESLLASTSVVEVKKAFESGTLYHVPPPSTQSSARFLELYHQVARG